MTGKSKPKPEASSSRGAKVKPIIIKRSSTSPVKAVAMEVDTPQQTSDTKGEQTVGGVAPHQTPYQRLHDLLASKTSGSRRVATVEELQAILRRSDGPTEKLTIRMKLVWVSGHTYQNFTLARLHLVDAASPEPLEDLLKLFRDSYDANRDEVDSVLLTATMWNVDSTSTELPPPGKVININGYSGLKLFHDNSCQLTVKLRDLSWEQTDP